MYEKRRREGCSGRFANTFSAAWGLGDAKGTQPVEADGRTGSNQSGMCLTVMNGSSLTPGTSTPKDSPPVLLVWRRHGNPAVCLGSTMGAQNPGLWAC